MPSSNDFARKMLDHMIGKTSFPMPTGNLYLGLATSAPTPASTGASFNEVTTGTYVDYVRKAVSESDFDPADTSRQLINNVKLTFVNPGVGSSGNVTHVVLLDASTGGNIIRYIAITGQPIAISNNNLPTFPIGSLIFNWD